MLHDESHQTELDGAGGGEVLLLHMRCSSSEEHLVPKRFHNQRARVVSPIKLDKVAVHSSETDKVMAHLVS